MSRRHDGEALGRLAARMPKMELHVHLEGAIPPATLFSLARRKNLDLPRNEAEMAAYFRFPDFDHFIHVYLEVSRALRDPEDFQLLVRDFLARRAAENVVYTEAHFTISTHVANGANANEVAEAVWEVLAAADASGGPRLRLIPDVVRNAPPARADQTVEWAVDNRHRGVVALGLGGKESCPAEPFREHFAWAAASGLGRVAHAGELEGPESVRATLAATGAQRLGHGIRIVDDPLLVEEIRERRIPLEICAASNVALGAVASLAAHPVTELYRAGVPFSIGSDDPTFFAQDLAAEYEAVAGLLELEPEEVAALALAPIAHSFLPAAEKEQAAARFARELEDLGEELYGRPLAAAG